MKDKIIQLHEKGYTYKQICDELGCNKSQINYYLNPEAKEKNRQRVSKWRKENPLSKKVENFQYSIRKRIFAKAHVFNSKTNKEKGRKIKGEGSATSNFTLKEVLIKIGETPICYLTGDTIDLSQPKTYHFDHIIPTAKGGTNSLDNLGIALKEANQAKSDLSLEEFLNLCEKILRYHGRIK